MCIERSVAIAKKVIDLCAARGVELVVPTDLVVATEFSNDASRKTVAVGPSSNVPDGWMGLDIGAASADRICSVISKAKTVFWNGPMGAFEMSNFASGTLAVARAMADASASGSATTIVGGGDSAAAVMQAGVEVASKITHISTGGGASLELIEGASMPGVACLDPL